MVRRLVKGVGIAAVCAVVAGYTASAQSTDGTRSHYTLTLMEGGLYEISVPAGSGAQIVIDGVVVLDASTAPGEVQLFTMIEPGSHDLELRGSTDLDGITLGQYGVPPISLADLAVPVGASADKVESAEEASDFATDSAGEPRLAGLGQFAPSEAMGGEAAAAGMFGPQFEGNIYQEPIEGGDPQTPEAPYSPETPDAPDTGADSGTSDRVVRRRIESVSNGGMGTEQLDEPTVEPRPEPTPPEPEPEPVADTPVEDPVEDPVDDAGDDMTSDGSDDMTDDDMTDDDMADDMTDDASDGMDDDMSDDMTDDDDDNNAGNDDDNNDNAGNDDDNNDDPAPAPTPQLASLPLFPSVTDVSVGELGLLTVQDGDILPSRGATLFGVVGDPMTFDMVQAIIQPSGRETIVDVGETNGQFAVRLFEDDLVPGQSVEVALTPMSSMDSQVLPSTMTYAFGVAEMVDGLEQALGRVTYGATDELFMHVLDVGFAAFVEEQLDPDSIDDSAFLATDPDSFVDLDEDSERQFEFQIMRHALAYASGTERQLNEVMGQFWANHFFASQKRDRVDYSKWQMVIGFRERALTSFYDLLLFSAESPVMSQFLDNDQNRAGNNRGNENYARELLELHTVGVDAGYLDADVAGVARIFTGWAYRLADDSPEDGAVRIHEFEFRPDNHDEDAKEVPFISYTEAGRSGEDGVQEGRDLLRALSRRPETQAFVCGKLVEFFVNDDRPQTFVDACIAAWAANDGDVKAMLRAILLHSDYLSTATLRSKAKTPFEYVVSYLRVFSDSLEDAIQKFSLPSNDPEFSDSIAFFYSDLYDRLMKSAGMDVLNFPVPTGFAEVSDHWLNTAATLAQYRQVTEVIDRNRNSGDRAFEFSAQVADKGLETAEDVASYLLALACAERYTQEEFEPVVAELKGQDGIFEPLIEDEDAALRRAMGVVVVLPCFAVQ